jgi:hypothetical protein
VCGQNVELLNVELGFRRLNRRKVVEGVGSADRTQPSAVFVMDDAFVFEGNINKISLVSVPVNIRK